MSIVQSVRRSSLLALLPLFLLAFFASCDSGDDDGVAEGSVCDRSVVEVQSVVAEIVQAVPGFAGCAPDPETGGGYIVNVTSLEVDLEDARAAIISRHESEADVLGIAPLRAVKLDVSLVSEWYEQAQSILITELPEEHKLDWIPAYADLNESYNQALIAFETEEAREWAQQKIIDEVEAPPGVIVAIQDSRPQLD